MLEKLSCSTEGGDDIIIVLVVLRGTGLKSIGLKTLIVFPMHNIACKFLF